MGGYKTVVQTVEIQEVSVFTPADKYNLAYIIFLIQGTGTLFPWNAFVAAPDYFTSMYGPNIMFYISMANTLPNLLGSIVMIFVGAKIPVQIKMHGPLFVLLAILITVPLIHLMKLSQTMGTVLILVLVFITGCSTAVLQSGFFEMAGQINPRMIQAFMTGNGIAGVAASVLRIITKVSISEGDTTLSAYVYFFISAGVIFACMIAAVAMVRLEYVRHHLMITTTTVSLENTGLLLESESIVEVKPKLKPFQIFKKVWSFAIMVFLVMFVTLVIFPGFCSEIIDLKLGDWAPIVMVAIYNCCDFTGRVCAGVKVIFSGRSLSFPILSRLLFIPLFIAFVIPTPQNPYINSYALASVSMVVIGITNGYLCSLCMMLAPSEVEDEEKGTAGIIMSFFLLFGIGAGSYVATGLNAIF